MNIYKFPFSQNKSNASRIIASNTRKRDDSDRLFTSIYSKMNNKINDDIPTGHNVFLKLSSFPIQKYNKDNFNGKDTLVFQITHYFNDIIKSYDTNENSIESNINKQFLLDCNRTGIAYDSKKIEDTVNLLDKFPIHEDDYITIDKYKFKISTWIKLLCSQSSFYLSFVVMDIIFKDIDRNIYVSDAKRGRGIFFTTNDDTNKITCELFSIFNVCDLDNEGKIVKELRTTITIDINLNNSNIFGKFGNLKWNIN